MIFFLFFVLVQILNNSFQLLKRFPANYLHVDLSSKIFDFFDFTYLILLFFP